VENLKQPYLRTLTINPAAVLSSKTFTCIIKPDEYPASTAYHKTVSLNVNGEQYLILTII
jgi:hypothetical protein